jgi:hypothetical protein
MKHIYRSICVIAILFTNYNVSAQVTGIKNIPVDYLTIQAAVADLNLVGVGAGGATINVPAGHVETFTAQVVLTMTSNPSTQANPLVFRKNGAGANPVITAFSPGISLTVDGVFILNSVDYVTIDGIDLRDNAANTTNTMRMEWGYALVKTSGSNGCQFNTIKNCSVTLTNANTAAVGIYIGNHSFLSTATYIVNNTGGTSSNNKFYNNSITDCYIGYSLNGYASGNPFDLYDQNNIIGVDGISTNRSQVLRFGGSTIAANGIFAINQNGLKIHSTYLNNTGAPNTTGTTMNGIFCSTGSNSNVDIYNDTITLVLNATTSQLTGINNAMGTNGTGNSVNIYNNVITGCTYPTATSAIFRGIQNTAVATFHNIYNNTVSNNTIPGTGEFACIYDAGSSNLIVKSINIYSNTVTGNVKTGTGGTFYALYGSASTNTISVYGNMVANNTAATTSGLFYGYYNFAVPINEFVYSNTFNNNTGGTGESIMIYARTGSGPTNKEIYNNTVSNITGNSAGGSVGGIWVDFGTTTNIYRNNIYNLTNNTTAGIVPAVYGINVGVSTNNVNTIHNNFISELKAPNASNVNAVYGMWLQGSTVSGINAYYNTIYLNAVSTGLNFGSSALTCGTNAFSIDLRNNILVNTSTPNGTGITKALVRGNTTLTSYNNLSGYNCLYAGTPGPGNLIFFDGTNSVQTLQGFKNLVGPRDQASFSSLPPFVNVATPPYNLHLQNSVATPCESGGTAVAGITSDYDNNVRAAIPDVGADEIAGITSDIASPDIQYVLVNNGPVALNRNLANFATITDPSGVNTTVGTKPRLYYKKSAEANTYAGNTAADNGWKYVEATNSSSPFTFNINYSLLFTGGNVIAGDVIQYFVTAQDLASVVNVGLNNGGFALQPASVNLSAAQFPLGNTINQYTIVANMYSGTLNVGPTETVTSLTNPGGMFDLINQGVLVGNTTLNITGDLTAETGAIALNQWAEDGVGNYTLTIQPSAAVTRSIVGSSAAGSLVRFNGADRVNIDGRFNNAGMFLLFRNTSNVHPSIGYHNDAQNHWLQYSIIESGNAINTNLAGGAVIIGTTSATNGNDNITISDCEIRDRSDVSGTPAWGINCNGTNGLITQYNHNVVIKNNNIHDFFLNGAVSLGVNVGAGNSNFNISNNSVYHTTPKMNSLLGGSCRPIFVSFSSGLPTNGGFTVTNNYIGGTAPLTAGGDMTLGVSAANISQSFIGLLVSTGMLAPNYIEGNVIRNIDYTTCAPNAAATIYNPIQVVQGMNSVGTLTGNTIGSPTANGSLKITLNTSTLVSTSFMMGIFAAPNNGSTDIRNNTIGGININGNSTGGALFLQWIQSQGTPIQDVNISNNLIGSTTTPSSIVNNVNCQTLTFGVRQLITNNAGLSMTTNTLQNLVDNSTNIFTAHYGLLATSNAGASGLMNISNNVFRNISVNVLSSSAAFVNLGISCQNLAGASHTIDANTVSGLSCTGTGLGLGYAAGIQVQGNTFGGVMRKNYVNGIMNSNTGSNPGIAGIYITSGAGWEVSNNMVSVTNGTNTNNCEVYGIAEFMGAGINSKFHYNSVYVGGSSPTGTVNSQAFYRGGNDNMNLRNNLFYNERSGSTATHVAIHSFNNLDWNPTSSNYNAFLTSDTTKLAIWSGTVTNLSGWKAFSTADMNTQKNITSSITAGPLFVNAANGDLHINTSTYPGGLGTPVTITTDIDNNARSATFPAVGADEIPCPAPAVTLVSSASVTCNGGSNGMAVVTATGGTSWTYSWSPVASTTQTVTNLAAGVYSVNVTNNCAISSVLTVTITEPSVIIPNSSFTQPSCNGGSNGSATLNPSGGTPGYTYSWSPASSTSSVASGLSAGVHNYTITDANACTKTGSLNITQPTAVFATGSTTSACSSQSNGAVTASVSGGTPGYTYSWSPNVSTTSVAVNLTPGTYTFQATDANGCTSASLPFIVGTNPSPTVSISTSSNLICAGSTVTLTANASAGVTYSWSSGGINAIEVTGPASSTVFTITVTYTATGCSAKSTVSITVSPCTGIAKLTGNAGIQMYPNPNKGQFFVSYYGFTQGASIEVYNTVGQLIIKKKVESLTTELSLNDKANGIYIVKVLNDKGHIEQVTKIVKE